MGNYRHHFSLCAQKEKGEAARNLSCTWRNQVVRTKWIMPYSLARWYRDNTKYISSFLTLWLFLFGWWSLGQPWTGSKRSSSPKSYPFLPKGDANGWHWNPPWTSYHLSVLSNSVIVSNSKGKKLQHSDCGFQPECGAFQGFFYHATWLLSPGERGFI